MTDGEVKGDLPPGREGVRIARVCPSEGCGWREFGDPKATCPRHGKGVDQGNTTYFGKQTAYLDKGKK